MGDRGRRALRAAVAPGDRRCERPPGAARGRACAWARAEHPHARAPASARSTGRVELAPGARRAAAARGAAARHRARLPRSRRRRSTPRATGPSTAYSRLPPGALGRASSTRWLAEQGAAPALIADAVALVARARARRLARGRSAAGRRLALVHRDAHARSCALGRARARTSRAGRAREARLSCGSASRCRGRARAAARSTSASSASGASA